MTIRVEVLQELPASAADTVEGCCALGSLVTCPWNTFDAAVPDIVTP
ncbi:hypothetical protein [Actinophytocola sp.]